MNTLKNNIFCTSIALTFSTVLFGQGVEEHLQFPTDNNGTQIFTHNPALPDPDQFYLQYAQIMQEREYEYTLDWDTSQPKVKQNNDHNMNAVGLSYPIGGKTAVGLMGQLLNQDHKIDFENANSVEEESFSERYAAVRFIAELVPKFRAGISIRYMDVDNDVAGSFFISDDERSEYDGSMTGFAGGLLYADQITRMGVSYAPPMRGKADIDGEEFIITEPGYLDLDLGYGQQKQWDYGVNIKRWFYQRDDRAEPQTTPVDQRQVSYNGIDLEQWLMPTMRYSVGFTTPYYGFFFIKGALSYTRYVFLFESDQVPGDDSGDETEVKAYQAKLAAAYSPDNFSIELGYTYEQREASNIDDTEGWFAGDYLDYKAIDSAFMATFIYVP